MDLIPLSSRRLQTEGGEMRAVGLPQPQHSIDRAGGLQDPHACSNLPHQSGTIHSRDNLKPVVRAFSIREGCHGWGDPCCLGWGEHLLPPAPWGWGWLLPPMCFAPRPSGGFAP